MSINILSFLLFSDGECLQETSFLSNVTDEGLDLSQRISDSIFQGPELAHEEEELLIGGYTVTALYIWCRVTALGSLQDYCPWIGIINLSLSYN